MDQYLRAPLLVHRRGARKGVCALYSAECVEGLFSEVHMAPVRRHKGCLVPTAPSLDNTYWICLWLSHRPSTQD